MYIHHRPAAALFKLLIGVLATGVEWYLFSAFGWAALRLFPSWVLFVTAIYFLLSALILALNRKATGKNPAPMFNGMIIMGFALMAGMAIASCQHQFYLPELSDWLMILLCVVLPILVLLDWLLFVKKGRWKAMMPFYWLALPACYAAAMIFSAHFMQDSAPLHYPLEIFNYFEVGVLDMLGWIAVIALLDLCVGYVLFLLDFALSGKLAQKIVLPHIQVVEIDEKGQEMHEQPMKVTTAKPEGLAEPEPGEPVEAESEETPRTEQEPAAETKPKSDAAATDEQSESADKSSAAEVDDVTNSIKVEIKPRSDRQKKPTTQKAQLKKMQETVGHKSHQAKVKVASNKRRKK